MFGNPIIIFFFGEREMFCVICFCHWADCAPDFLSYVGLVLKRKQYRVDQIWHGSNHLVIGYCHVERSALMQALI